MRIATFNIENLDDAPPASSSAPTFEERLAVLRPALERMKADIVCFQEVHGQDVEGEPRRLRALETLLAGTRYGNHQLASTTLKGKPDVERFRNLVTAIPPGWRFAEIREILHDKTPSPKYGFVTSSDGSGAKDIRWERPLFHTIVESPNGVRLHVLNAHFKSKNPTRIPGQGPESFRWRTAAGWAEGFFVSSVKRVGAALEARMVLDAIFEAEPEAKIVLCGDLNAESHEVPVLALRGDVEDTGNPALNHMVMFPAESSVPEDQRFSLYHHGRKNMLDHLLVSRALIACYRGTEVHNETLHDESVAFAVDKKYPESDHAPIIAEFEIGGL